MVAAGWGMGSGLQVGRRSSGWQQVGGGKRRAAGEGSEVAQWQGRWGGASVRRLCEGKAIVGRRGCRREAKRLLWGSQGAEKWPLENWSWEVKRQGAVSGGRRSAMEKLG